MLKKKENSNSNINDARILYYDFFAGLFIYDLLDYRSELLLEQIKILKQIEEDEKKEHFSIIESSIKEYSTKNLLLEYTNLFMLPFNTNINTKKVNDKEESNAAMLYLSYYLDGSIAGVGLSIAKEKVKKSKIRLNDVSFKENEEHFGFLLLFCKKLLQNKEFSLQKEVLKECLYPMYNNICKSLEQLGEEYLYYHISIILKEFLDFESSVG
ncbi:hypothetical protein [Helicobacter sp. MIT 14-3879]|uniref:hypothetical protein n=1 Tax=Helicobacter sp. MIT 14-3879 TaxID=2040649 RepID=UPI000E1F1FCC|nr:hypothetical protein [Helicobacter sp. MIT 14-3879]RDU64860.1 hypothetical protein CQA44_03900 [Helicobacter sp. MIT 14-3879]